MDYRDIFIKDDYGRLVPIESAKNFCGRLYAAMGYNGDKEGDLFAVMCGPRLFPAYDCFGNRFNVGNEHRGMSYSKTHGWYNE